MARVDKEKFPKLVIQIPQAEFPDKITIVIFGNNYPVLSPRERVGVSIAAETLNVAGGERLPDTSKIITEKDFTSKSKIKNIDYKVAKIDTPFSEISEIRCWASRSDNNNDTPINVEMFTTTQNNERSIGSYANIGFGGVFAYSTTLRKNHITVDYAVDYFLNGTQAGNIAKILMEVTPLVKTTIDNWKSKMAPTPPTPKSLASKLLGPKAAQLQTAIAQASQQNAEFLQIAEQAIGIAMLINRARTDPKARAEVLKLLLIILINNIPQEEAAKVVYNFRG